MPTSDSEPRRGRKITSSQVVEIREARARGEMCTDIAARFGVGRTTIGKIARGQIWHNLDGKRRDGIAKGRTLQGKLCERIGCDMADEEWRAIDGYPDHKVSNHGRVKRGPLVLSPIYPKKNYPTVGLRHQGARATLAIHRLVARAFIGPCPIGHEIDHIDLDKNNPHLFNLEYVTHVENMRRAVANGVMDRGEGHHCAKLNPEKALAIAGLIMAGLSSRKIGRLFGVSQRCVLDIAHGKNWDHVTGIVRSSAVATGAA